MTQKGTPITETIETDQMDVACDGGNGRLGHPRVWLHIRPETRDIVCPYCSRRYVLKEGAKAAAAH